jgi:hypothetical protein
VEKLAVSKDLFKKALLKNLVYIGKRSYLLHWDASVEEVKRGSVEKARVVVLNKEHYFETTRTFPFSNIKEIASAIKMDMGAFSPIKTSRFFLRKTGQTNEVTNVNLWFVTEAVAELLRTVRPLLIIPETALLSFLEPGSARIYSVHKDDETLFVHIEPDGTVRSTTSRGRASDLQSFRRMIGFGARECSASDIAGNDYLTLLPAMLEKVPLRTLVGFVNADFFPHAVNRRQLKRGLVVACCMVFLYMIAATLMPYLVAERLKEKDAALSNNLSGLMEKQALIESYSESQRELAKKINSYTYKVPLLNLLSEVLPQGTKITNLTISGNTVEMKGRVSRAADLLDGLAKVEEIEGAHFTSPLKKHQRSGKEVFALTFTHVPQQKAESER